MPREVRLGDRVEICEPSTAMLRQNMGIGERGVIVEQESNLVLVKFDNNLINDVWVYPYRVRHLNTLFRK